MEAFTFLVLLISLSPTFGRRIVRENPIVDTNVGQIQGVVSEDGDYTQFLGIPYARVNESNPFGASLSYPNFDTIYVANDDSITCPSVRMPLGGVGGSLDCLRLNVYVPNTTDGNELPVLIWIHGGAFTGGSGTGLGPKPLIRHDIILVSINYRLGPYGFMCLDTPEVPGNQGLKDQYTAVEWVRDNIAAFGGDADKITVFGQSAGGMSIDMHLLSKRPKVFNQAILQSGNALCPEEVIPSDRTIPIKLAAHLGYETDDTEDALKYLINSNEHSVISSFQELSIYIRPCVEQEFDGVIRFISEHPEHATPNFTEIPIIAGFNSHEELLLMRTFDKYFEGEEDPFESYLEPLFNFGDDKDEMIDNVRRFYIGDNRLSEDQVWELINFLGDIKHAHTMSRTLNRYIENGAQNVYHYVNHYVGDRTANNIPNFTGTKPGAAHMDELVYLFDVNTNQETTADDQLFIDRFTTMWANFVKYGDPTPETTELLPVKWNRVTKDVFNYLRIDLDPFAYTRPFHDRLAFWDLFFIFNEDKFFASN